MVRQLRRRVSYANVVSTIALFGVLAGGGAYAATKIGPGDIAKNAVRAKHVKKKQVRSKHIRNGAVTKPKLAAPLRGTTHFARVKSDGTLIDGTATDASRVNDGSYFVEFPASIRNCAGAASSAFVPGSDSSVLRMTTQLSIGVGEGGAPDNDNVRVRLYTNTGTNEDSSFTLVLVCP